MVPSALQTILQSAVEACFADNTGAQGRRDYYGIVVANARPCKGHIDFDLALTFKAGERYCCFEDGCHHSLSSKDGWRLLREHLGRMGYTGGPPLVLSVLRVRVEKGARASYGGLLVGEQETVVDDGEYQSGPYAEMNVNWCRELCVSVPLYQTPGQLPGA
jgi:hypothetical protein